MLSRCVAAASRNVTSKSMLLSKIAVSKQLLANPMMVTLKASHVTIDIAKKMPRKYEELSNDVLVTIAVLGDQEAREERLIREIMAVDNKSWKEAEETFLKIVESNRKHLFISTLPYKFGIFVSVSAGLASIPLIFELNTVLLFNEMFVTTDVPEAKDLETPLEVGSWAWNWMEPPLGQISFFLLCMQYARAQLQNLGAKPYTEWFKNKRAERLCKEFPNYDKFIMVAFSEGDPLHGEPINR
jgi:hypothetical protein